MRHVVQSIHFMCWRIKIKTRENRNKHENFNKENGTKGVFFSSPAQRFKRLTESNKNYQKWREKVEQSESWFAFFSLSLFSFPRGRTRLFCLKLLSKIKSKSYSSAYLQYRNDDDVHCSNISWHFLLFIRWIELCEHWTLSKKVKRLHFLLPDANKEFILKPNEFLYTLSFLKSFSMRHFH